MYVFGVDVDRIEDGFKFAGRIHGNQDKSRAIPIPLAVAGQAVVGLVGVSGFSCHDSGTLGLIAVYAGKHGGGKQHALRMLFRWCGRVLIGGKNLPA